MLHNQNSVQQTSDKLNKVLELLDKIKSKSKRLDRDKIIKTLEQYSVDLSTLLQYQNEIQHSTEETLYNVEPTTEYYN